MNATPYSVRLPADMKNELTRWAESEHRSLHSLILQLLDEAIRRRQSNRMVRQETETER